MLAVVFATTYFTFAQVQIDQQLQMTGASDAQRRITNVGDPAGINDAVNTSTLQKGSLSYALASGSGGNYLVTLSPAPTAYSIGMIVNFKSNHANTGAATLKVGTLAAVSIKTGVTSDLTSGDILNNQMVSVMYDGTNFQLLSRGAALTSLPPSGPAGGDLSGTYPNPTVDALQNRPVASTAPASNDVLKWNGSSWAPAVDANTTYSAGTGLSLSGTTFNNTGVTSIATNNGITGGTITTTGTVGLTGQALALHNLGSNGMITRTGAGTVAARTIAVTGTGINISNGNGVSGNPSLSLNYGTNLNVASNGQYPVGNFGQFQTHSTYTNFNTVPNYWGWNFVQGESNAPNTTGDQWYRVNVSLGSEYPGRGTGGYSMEVAYPRFNTQQAGGIWMRTVENGTFGNWMNVSGPPVGSIVAWHKTLMGGGAPPSGWVECNGQTLSDAASPLNGQVIPNLNSGGNSTYGGTTNAGRFLRGSTSSGSFQQDILPSLDIDQSSSNQGSNGGATNDGSTANYSGWMKNYYLDDSFRWRYIDREVRPLSFTVVWIMKVK